MNAKETETEDTEFTCLAKGALPNQVNDMVILCHSLSSAPSLAQPQPGTAWLSVEHEWAEAGVNLSFRQGSYRPEGWPSSREPIPSRSKGFGGQWTLLPCLLSQTLLLAAASDIGVCLHALPHAWTLIILPHAWHQLNRLAQISSSSSHHCPQPLYRALHGPDSHRHATGPIGQEEANPHHYCQNQ